MRHIKGRRKVKRSAAYRGFGIAVPPAVAVPFNPGPGVGDFPVTASFPSDAWKNISGVLSILPNIVGGILGVAGRGGISSSQYAEGAINNMVGSYENAASWVKIGIFAGVGLAIYGLVSN